jgi:hypothetical protein
VTFDYHSFGAQKALSLLAGTYVDGDMCTYTASGTLLNCSTAVPSGSGTVNSGTSGQLAYYSSTGAAVSGTTAIPNGTTATTQSPGDNSTKVATTAYVSSPGAIAPTNVTASGTVSASSYSIGGVSIILPSTLTGYNGNSSGVKIPLSLSWNTPSALTSVCHDANGNLTDASCPSASGTGFNGGAGTSYQDALEIAAPANPASTYDRLYLDSTAHQLKCLTSSGGSCMPSGSMTYPGAGIGVSTGSAWGTSLTAPTGALVGAGQANTYTTGLQDFSSATMKLPASYTIAGPYTITQPGATGTLALTSAIPSVGTWGALNYPTWVSGTPFVKMTAAGTFALDTNAYLTANQTITLGGILSGSGGTSITAAAAAGYYMPTTTDEGNWNGKQAALGYTPANCTAGTSGSDCLQLSSGLVPAANLPTATTIAQGAVRPDGTTITIAGGVISSTGGGGFNPASPGPIGGTTPSTGAFTNITATGTVTAGATTPTTIGSSGVLLNGVPALQSQTSLNNYYSGGAGNLTGTGNDNTANGFQALQSNTAGSYNAANGMYALNANTIGAANIANGFQALAANTSGNYNTANGHAALHLNTTGSNNSANGFQALDSNTTGNSNTANGYQALYSNTTGSNNTANGYAAGQYIADGVTANQTSSNSVYEGYQAYPLASGDTNENVIGNTAIGHGSNTTTLGNSSTIGTWKFGTQHITATAPTASAGSVAAYSTNAGGEITGLSAATSVTITFANSGWTNAAFCTANSSTTLATNVYNSIQSNTAVTFTFPALTGNLFYHCDGN